MIVVEIADSISATLPSEILRNAQLERVAQETLCIAGASSEGDLTILISDDEHLRRLNHQFLGIDEPTDVLSFPAGHIDPDTNTIYLGDVIISYPRAKEQAASAGQLLEHELRLLVAHGVLHLLGFDHATPEGEAQMWALQESILKNLNPDA